MVSWVYFKIYNETICLSNFDVLNTLFLRMAKLNSAFFWSHIYATMGRGRVTVGLANVIDAKSTLHPYCVPQ